MPAAKKVMSVIIDFREIVRNVFQEIKITVTDSPLTSISTVALDNREPLANAVIHITSAAIGREHLSVGELLLAVGTEGPSLATALLTLPFLQPVPLPGLSTPIGITIALSGVGLFLNRPVHLPNRVSKMQMPVSAALKGAEFLARFELKLKPYLKSDSTLDPVFTRHLLGVAIVIHGTLLALPLPVPLSNMLPAWMCFMAAMTVLFSSRRLFAVSVLLLLVNIAFWTALVFAAMRGSTSIVNWLDLTFG